MARIFIFSFSSTNFSFSRGGNSFVLLFYFPERESAANTVSPATSLDNAGTKSGRSSEGGRGGRKKYFLSYFLLILSYILFFVDYAFQFLNVFFMLVTLLLWAILLFS